jgi:hypothetical protein
MSKTPHEKQKGGDENLPAEIQVDNTACQQASQPKPASSPSVESDQNLCFPIGASGKNVNVVLSDHLPVIDRTDFSGTNTSGENLVLDKNKKISDLESLHNQGKETGQFSNQQVGENSDSKISNANQTATQESDSTDFQEETSKICAAVSILRKDGFKGLDKACSILHPSAADKIEVEYSSAEQEMESKESTQLQQDLEDAVLSSKHKRNKSLDLEVPAPPSLTNYCKKKAYSPQPTKRVTRMSSHSSKKNF